MGKKLHFPQLEPSSSDVAHKLIHTDEDRVHGLKVSEKAEVIAPEQASSESLEEDKNQNNSENVVNTPEGDAKAVKDAAEKGPENKDKEGEAEKKEQEKEEEEEEAKEEEEEEAKEESLPTEATAAGEDKENEGNNAVSVAHNTEEGDVFGDEYDLDLDDDNYVVVVSFDDEEINRFYQEQIASDSNFNTPTAKSNPANSDSFQSYGNTQLNVGGGGSPNSQFKSFNFFGGFSLFSEDISEISRGISSGPALVVEGSVLANDEGEGLVVLRVDNVTEGAVVDMQKDGTFTYVPPAGWRNTTDSFNYLMQNSNGETYTGTVTIQIGERIWFVDNSSVALPEINQKEIVMMDAVAVNSGTGTSIDPYTSLQVFLSEDRPDAPGDIIFIRTGGFAYEAGFTLLDNQILLGEGADLIVDGHLLWSAGMAPTLTNSDGSINDGVGLNLANNNTLSGFNIENTVGIGINAVDIENAKLSLLYISNTGEQGIYLGNVEQNFIIKDLQFNTQVSSSLYFDIENSDFNLFLINNYFGSSSTASIIQGNSTGLNNIHFFANANFLDSQSATGVSLFDEGSGQLNLVLLNNIANTNMDYEVGNFDLFLLHLGSSSSILPGDVISDLNSSTTIFEVQFTNTTPLLQDLAANFSALPSLDQDFINNELSVL